MWRFTLPAPLTSSSHFSVEGESNNLKTVKMLRQTDLFLAFIVVLPTILSGLETCYSSIALPQMSLTVAEASWFASGPSLAAAAGSLLLGWIMDRYGRKVALALCPLLNIVGWALIASNRGVAVVLCGRLFTGLPVTFVCYASQVYITECLVGDDKYLRDTMRTWPTIGFAVGQLAAFLLGALVTHLQLAAAVTLLSAVAFAAICFYAVESPDWLYVEGRAGDAELASLRLRRRQPRPKGGSAAAVGGADAQRLPLVCRTRCFSRSDASSVVRTLRQRVVYKPVLLMMAVCTLAMFTGGMAVSSYMVNIIDASQPGLDETTTSLADGVAGTTVGAGNADTFRYSVISGLLMVLGTVLLSLQLPRRGARTLTIGSAGCMCVGMLLIGVTNDRRDPSDLRTLRLVSVWLVSFVFSLGMMVPISILGEMFPAAAKGFASLVLVVHLSSWFLVAETYPYLYQASRSGVFYGYAAMSVAYACLVYVFMPETVGRDYEQISSSF